jgi:hypothetical protein
MGGWVDGWMGEDVHPARVHKSFLRQAHSRICKSFFITNKIFERVHLGTLSYLPFHICFDSSKQDLE